MSVEDFRINATVRQVLSRHWVDTQALSYGAAARIVFFHGRFQKLRPPRPAEERAWERDDRAQVAEDLTLLQNVERQVRADPNVVDVVFRLDNFRKVRGKWENAGA